MNNHSELISISGSMDTSGEYLSYYEFASKYIDNMKEKKISDTEIFFNTIKKLENHSDCIENIEVFGKESVHAGISIKKWCRIIQGYKPLLEGLSIDELHYVFGYCSRLSKIHKEQK